MSLTFKNIKNYKTARFENFLPKLLVCGIILHNSCNITMILGLQNNTVHSKSSNIIIICVKHFCNSIITLFSAPLYLKYTIRKIIFRF